MKNAIGSAVPRALWNLLFVIPLSLVLVVPFFVAGAVLGTYLAYSHKLPEIPELANYQPRTVSTFFAEDGTVIGIFYKQKRFVVDLQQIPTHVVKAFVGVEDARFYEHSGVDWPGLARAMIRNLQAGRMAEGGSTISMQVTRNFMLTKEKRIARKLKEMILARRLERMWGKEKILYIYLNEIYLGDGCYGVEAAARNYFDKPVEHLTLAEAALLAGLVSSPSRYNPFKNANLASLKQKLVLRNMLRYGFITQEAFDRAASQTLQFRKEAPRPFDLVPDYAEAVRRYIVAKYGEDKLYNEGLKVFTACRVDYQKYALEAARKGVAEIKARHKHFAIIRTVDRTDIAGLLEERATPKLKEGRIYQGVVTRVTASKSDTVLDIALSKKLVGRATLEGKTDDFKVGHVLAVRFEGFMNGIPYFTPDDDPVLQSAMVVVENRTGYVRALVGGTSEERFKFHRAIQARRQPGSAFKPFIYATAIEQKSYSPATIIVDEEIEVDLGREDRLWAPKNAGGNVLGPLSLRRALELSRNICTIKILMDVGLDPVIETARKMGVSSRLGRNLSLSLGTSELTLLELTSAYTVFPNGGIHVQPTLIKRIEDRFGNVLEDNSKIPVLDEDQIPHPTPREELKEVQTRLSYPRPTAVTEEETEDDENEPAGEDTSQAEFDKPARPRPTTKPEKFPEERLGTRGVRDPEEPRAVTAALSPQTAYIMTDLLMGGVRSGTGSRLGQYLKRRDVAGKTGTTNQAADAWFIGFNPELTAGVWVGFDEKRPLGRREEGARSALPIWAYFMKEALEGKPERQFPVPPDIVFAEMTTYTGPSSEGSGPSDVREPIYKPFLGRTLILSPLDPPETLRWRQRPVPQESVSGHVERPPGAPAPPQGPVHLLYPRTQGPAAPPQPYAAPTQPPQPGPVRPPQPQSSQGQGYVAPGGSPSYGAASPSGPHYPRFPEPGGPTQVGPSTTVQRFYPVAQEPGRPAAPYVPPRLAPSALYPPVPEEDE